MATPYSKTVNQIKSQPVKIKGSWFLKHKVFVVISILIIAFIAWFNSDFWPWPSKDRIRERLDKVIDICTDNENSSDCKNIQKKYGMTFRYCHSIADMNKTQTVYLNGQSFQMPSFSWYAVAWEGVHLNRQKMKPDFQMELLYQVLVPIMAVRSIKNEIHSSL